MRLCVLGYMYTKSGKGVAERLGHEVSFGWKIGLHRDSTVGVDLGLETGDLTGGEVVHTRVVRVVHVVVDGWKGKEMSDQVPKWRCEKSTYDRHPGRSRYHVK